MKALILTFLLLSSSNILSKECFINTFEKILYTPSLQAINSSEFIKKSDCPRHVQDQFANYIQNSNGSLSTSLLARHEIFDPAVKIKIHPKKIEIINLKHELKKRFQLSSNWSFENLSFLKNIHAVGLQKNARIQFNCELCHTTGRKNISLNIKKKHFTKTHWLKGTVNILTTALVPRRALSPAEPMLTASDFELKRIKAIRPESYFTNIEQINFYKLNKTLPKGSGLKFSDMSPVLLVTAGVPTKLILKNAGITLHGKAIPNRGGKFGDIIKLRNPKTKRLISGKIIDYNKVMVDL